MKYKNLKTFFSKLSNLPDEFYELSDQYITEMKFKKSDIISEQVKTDWNFYFLESGFAMVNYTLEGDIHTTQFIKPGEVFITTYNLSVQFEICFSQDSSVLAISDDRLKEMGKQFAEASILDLRIKSYYCEVLEYNSIFRRLKSGERRLEKLLEQYPDIFEQAPAYAIASYLSISEKSLKKIKGLKNTECLTPGTISAESNF